jgi:hypothetical protein
VLDNRGMAQRFGYTPPDWREALRPVIAGLR